MDQFDPFKRPEVESQNLYSNMCYALPLGGVKGVPLLPSVPSVTVIEDPTYETDTYVLSGLCVQGFDRVEKKRLLMSRSYECNIRNTVEILQGVVRMMSKPLK